MLRVILGVVAGVIAGFVTVWCVESVGHLLWPVSTNIDFSDREAVKAFLGSMPLGALATVTVAWITGAYVAAMVALVIGARKRVAGIVAGGLVLAATITNLLMLPHPGWMAATGVGGILLAIWLADALFARKTA